MIRVWREGGTVYIDVNGSRLSLSVDAARVLARKLGAEVGLRVSLGVPAVRYRKAPGGYIVDIMEGSRVKSVVVPRGLVEAYVEAARRLGPGRYHIRDFVEKALRIAVLRGAAGEAAQFLHPGLDWESLFGHRELYYRYARAPILLLHEMGIIEYKRNGYVVVKKRWRK